ncbi:hypothetical protein BDZ89DRAFT_1075488 [Hymenopellis radicata]|nr:hypothetical protein BDZ89DRAFT_1075488 [Hymenopellis radicata]
MANDFVPPAVFPQDDTHKRPEKRQRLDDGSSKRNGPSQTVHDSDVEMRDVSNESDKFKRKADNIDPLNSLKDTYRLLDLISEQSSGGTVDKIIIDQLSLSSFINDVCPGAYQSMTRVDFKALDRLSLQPIGLYGPKNELAAFLVSVGVLREDAQQRIVSDNLHIGLRSGLYLVKASPASAYVVYWPEKTTWNDDCVSSVRRNRVTFMRYLSKIAHQVVCLIPPEIATTLVWKIDESDDILPMDLDEESFDRMFTFEVSKSNQQDEDVAMRPGFEVHSKAIDSTALPTDSDDVIEDHTYLPRLLNGETTQAFVTTSYKPSTETRNSFTKESCSPLKLRDRIVDAGHLSIDADADHETIRILVDNGLDKCYPDAVAAWHNRARTNAKEILDWKDVHHNELKEAAPSEEDVRTLVRHAVIKKVLDKYPSFDKLALCGNDDDTDKADLFDERLDALINMYPSFQDALDKTDIKPVTKKEFINLKRHIVGTKDFLDTHHDLTSEDRESFITAMLSQGLEQSLAKPERKGILATIAGYWTTSRHSSKLEKLADFSNKIPDGQFLANLDVYHQVEPRLRELTDEAKELAVAHLQHEIDRLSKTLTAKAMAAIKDACKNQLSREENNRREQARRESQAQLLSAINDANRDHLFCLTIGVDSDFLVTGSTTRKTDAVLVYTVHELQIAQDHQQTMKMDPSFVPNPHVADRFNHSFEMPLSHRILYFHVVEGGKLLLIVGDGSNVSVYFESGYSLQNAIAHRRSKKVVHEDKLEHNLLFAFDERKRMLLICAPTKLQLHLFCFDESFGVLQGWGSAVILMNWYQPGVSIVHACFILNNEEVFLVDSSGQARIFSLVTQQFRPATLSLNTIPDSIHPSPDGACLFMVKQDQDAEETMIHAYHCSTFGSGEPFTHTLPFKPSGPLLLTALINRVSIHLVGLDFESHAARSFAFDITTKITEFQFKEQNARKVTTLDCRTVHNSLIDCHSDVWTRFPVVAAIRHHLADVRKAKKTLLFATDRDFGNYRPHFDSLVLEFEHTTGKPTENTLVDIHVFAVPLRDLHAEVGKLLLSEFRLGEWLVAFLCLIPIHIAVTRENRFLPLKDGVISPAWEKTLLGAEVGKIVDSLTLGWYESIFQSYMAQKPVKVVSSMGEQSVGKSYSLNHLVDSSFAGSAMRTTEGVWLSCTPTDDALVVALDFEGVHSIERSAQEDTLLVLFNTAVSNLVLFRNNFALSRNITGLFQSFQSSSTVLDPAANPTLFQSTLVIIIKDVVDSDKNEIVKEFSLKFQKIVQEEQDSNFISRLHAGRLNIVPWPVIESKNFYTLFHALRKRLDQQTVTHPAAGQFLLTLKTLMAKLKANDWGSISQTLVAHRAQQLTNLLPVAMMYGLAEIEPQEEPLKNFDTDELIQPDAEANLILWLDTPSSRASRDKLLSDLSHSWPGFSMRAKMSELEWFTGLSQYLHGLVDARIDLVHQWIEVNLARFSASHASISDLGREFEKLQVDLKSGVELCRMKCASCNLLCVGNRRHDSDVQHDCQTSHVCPQPCEYVDEHEGETKPCGYPAGHSGMHICAVDTHLCGQPCGLKGRPGCLGECTQVSLHEGDHLCDSKNHACGQPCSLQDVKLPGGKRYTCKNTCTISSDEDHETHVCENRMCPITCELCKRLCAFDDHLHAQKSDAVHLCGQEHSCMALCASPGSCDIETAPQSIKATFTGRHETFEYTKRLKCAIMIPSGERRHPGPHVHTTDPTRVHFCEESISSSVSGHPQQFHETSHGSMSKARWAIDGPAGTTLEVDGHKYGSEDDGAPMMCNLVCTNLGRHVHLDYCRTKDGRCTGTEVCHVEGNVRFNPNPDQPKDWISHSLFWRRSDPYSRDDQTNFAKCDAMCPAVALYLTLFHAPETSDRNVGLGYRSHDGHVFPCKNPAVLQQAFHVIFVIDRSSSMGCRDRLPLPNTPVTAQIQRMANNRLGAVYSALYGFWTSRRAAVTGQAQGAAANRRDAYSVILFDHTTSTVLANDFTSSPEDLLNTVSRYGTGGGTDFELALDAAKTVMRQHWSTERTPVVIFLSDGECSLPDAKVQDLCRASITLGKSLSLHTVSFGTGPEVLRRMARLALDIQASAPADPNAPVGSRIDSSFSEALDSVRLATTFLSIAESLRKPRGALMQG